MPSTVGGGWLIVLALWVQLRTNKAGNPGVSNRRLPAPLCSARETEEVRILEGNVKAQINIRISRWCLFKLPYILSPVGTHIYADKGSYRKATFVGLLHFIALDP